MPASPERPLIFVVDDESNVLDSLTIFLTRSKGYRVRSYDGIADALDALDAVQPDAVLTDIAMDGREAGIDLLRAVRSRYPDVPVLLMSAVASREAAIAAINARAAAFLEKPFTNDELAAKLHEAIASAAARSAAREVAKVEVDRLNGGRRSQAQSRRHNHPGARAAHAAEAARQAARERRPIGEAPAFLETLALLEQAAHSAVTVLLEGESGVGKGVLAAYLHAASPRRSGKFLSINCGALPETLLESTLFGHTRGSFTGADADNLGLVRAADGGTLFFDEVGELTPASQVKLLRVLQEREVIPVGGTEASPVDVRFVAATNRDLRRAVAEGRFREDLFWRLNVLAVRVPPLRERVEDVPLLAVDALEQIRRRDPSVQAERFADAALVVLGRHPWPGNVRELQNAIERAAITAGSVVGVEDLPDDVRRAATSDPEHREATPTSAGTVFGVDAGAMPTLALMERAYVAFVVQRAQGDVDVAATQLGIPAAAVRAILGAMP